LVELGPLDSELVLLDEEVNRLLLLALEGVLLLLDDLHPVQPLSPLLIDLLDLLPSFFDGFLSRKKKAPR